MPIYISCHQQETRPTLTKTHGIVGERKFTNTSIAKLFSGTPTLISRYTVIPMKHDLCLSIKLIHIFL